MYLAVSLLLGMSVYMCECLCGCICRCVNVWDVVSGLPHGAVNLEHPLPLLVAVLESKLSEKQSIGSLTAEMQTMTQSCFLMDDSFHQPNAPLMAWVDFGPIAAQKALIRTKISKPVLSNIVSSINSIISSLDATRIFIAGKLMCEQKLDRKSFICQNRSLRKRDELLTNDPTDEQQPLN